jgi:hypothetical protein
MRSLEELDDDVVDLKREVHNVADRLDKAPFVRVELHNEQVDRLRADIAGVRALAMWTLGIMCSAIVGAILVFVIAVARSGPA